MSNFVFLFDLFRFLFVRCGAVCCAAETVSFYKIVSSSSELNILFLCFILIQTGKVQWWCHSEF